jgi:hypothetical protein
MVTPSTTWEPEAPPSSWPPPGQFPAIPGKTATAGLGKIAHAIMSRVAAVTAIRPAVVRRLLSLVLVLVLREPIICSDLPFALPVGTTGGYLLSHY